MGTSTLAQTKTIFKVMPSVTADAHFIVVSGVVCALPNDARGIIATLVEYSNAVEQARDQFVQAAQNLGAAAEGSRRERALVRAAYEEAFETLERAICQSWNAQQKIIQEYRVAVVRGGVAFYANEGGVE